MREEEVAALLSEKWILWSPSRCQSLSVPMISKNIGHSPIIPVLRWWKCVSLSVFVVAVCLCVCVCVSVQEIFILTEVLNLYKYEIAHLDLLRRLSQDRLYLTDLSRPTWHKYQTMSSQDKLNVISYQPKSAVTL